MLSVSRGLYEQLFVYLVHRLNEKIKPDEEIKANEKWIGILDIFGFEYFQTNSLEQFFINY